MIIKKLERGKTMFPRKTKNLIALALGLLTTVLITISILQVYTSQLLAIMTVGYYLGGILTAIFILILLNYEF